MPHQNDGKIHLLTDRDLARIQKLCPDSLIDARRFRPNIVATLSDDADNLAPGDRITTSGGVVLQVEKAAERCPMVTHAQREAVSYTHLTLPTIYSV